MRTTKENRMFNLKDSGEPSGPANKTFSEGLDLSEKRYLNHREMFYTYILVYIQVHNDSVNQNLS